VGRVSNRKTLQHHLGIGDGLAGMMMIRRSRSSGGLDCSVSRRLSGIGHGGRGIVLNVAGIAVIGRVVVLGKTGPIAEGIVIKIEGIGAAVVVSFILNPSSMTNPPASGSRHDGWEGRLMTL